MEKRIAAALAGAALAAACARAPGPEPPPPAAAPLPAPAEATLATPCPRIAQLEVRKAERALVVACADGGRRAFPIALSREPGAKRARGDQRMPEGEYRVAGPARASRFHRFLPIDYPSRADAERALAEGRITPGERDAIARAHAARRLPPQQTALGGDLGLHGEGRRWRGDLALDWTEGCVAVTDRVIDWLARRAPPGTPVRILP